MLNFSINKLVYSNHYTFMDYNSILCLINIEIENIKLYVIVISLII